VATSVMLGMFVYDYFEPLMAAELQCLLCAALFLYLGVR
jgi:hypothetical protein